MSNTFFDALDGQDYFFDSVKEEIKSSGPMLYSLISSLATFEDKDSGNNLVATFDNDLSFSVCDNSATGHICNNTLTYHSTVHLYHQFTDLKQLTKIVTVKI